MGAAELEALAARLRLLRARRGLTVEALERRSGLGHTTVSQVLNGRKVPSEATVVALAQALRADPEELLALRVSAAPKKAPDADTAFEKRYRDYLIGRYSRLTVVGLDLEGPGKACWPLDAAYLSLELAEHREFDEPHNITVERAERALAGRRRTLIRGLAGSGKTTLLQWLAVIAARQDPPEELAHLGELIPFVLPLRTLDRQTALPAPEAFLGATGSVIAPSQPAGWADRVLAAGRGLLLIDGLDEVPKQRRERTRDWLRDLLAAYPDAHYLITTRPSAVPDQWLTDSAFTELTVRPMNRRDVFVFISRWHCAAGASAELEENLKDSVRSQRDLAQLATTPLMCALICALHRDRRGHLPHSRMELYEAALSMLLIRRDHERGIDSPEGIVLNRHQAVQLIQRLAYWLIRNGQAELEEETALALIEEALPAMPAVAGQGDAGQVLAHLLARSGLLRRPTADTIDFVHRTFQDYLGAKAAVEARDLGLLVKNAHDDQWEDVLRMAVAHARPAERATLLRRLVARGDRTAKHRTRLHLLAMACLAQATELDPEIRRAIESRGSALLPPRSYEEAKELAAAGPVILDLLPGPQGLASDEAQAVAQTAVRVGGDAAFTLLRHFRACPEAQIVLAGAWNLFDTEEYSREILRHLSPEIRITVSSPCELKALGRLPQKTRLSFVGDFTAKAIMSAVDPRRVQDLHIAANENSDILCCLRELPELESLTLSQMSCELSPLRALPLKQLTVWWHNELDLHTLNPLHTLEELNLRTTLAQSSLADFPSFERLRRLYLWEETLASTTLNGVRELTGLEFLSLFVPAVDNAALGELPSLPHLTELQLVSQDVNSLVDFPPLPLVKRLSLTRPLRYENLRPIKDTYSGSASAANRFWGGSTSLRWPTWPA
ncbi:NACHT domain-containing protein [Streptomyces sp. NPDC049577]|uniref:NACHT domain-containing protein n=1 Tax=Streptomyces sp. NPDC049577 TaxID=3155153 RepID=UPI0034156CBD